MAGETLLKGRYELTAQQGSGGMSVIYRAFDRDLQRIVAVKILRPSLTQNPEFLEKFRQEARAVANLSHPNIVTVHDVGNDGPTHYIVMELVDGQDLKKIIQSIGVMPIDRVLHLATQICAGIGYAHRSGLVHADIKPQNILVTTQDVVKVTDFGIAQAFSDTQPKQRADVVWGSPHYFAPEQAKGEQPTPASDVYAIGIVLFEMLTGQLPYTGVSQQDLALAHIRTRIPLVTEVNPAIPDALAKIVYRVMEKEPNRRYQQADQLGNVLQQYRMNANANTMTAQPPLPPTMPRQALQNPPSPGVLGRDYAPTRVNPPTNTTERYSAAPNAPQPYNPRQPQPQQGAQGQPIATPPQPLEQRYVVQNTPTPMPPTGNASGYYTPYQSQPMRPPQNLNEPRGTDFVTIILAFLAFILVAGLVPLFIVVIAAWTS